MHELDHGVRPTVDPLARASPVGGEFPGHHGEGIRWEVASGRREGGTAALDQESREGNWSGGGGGGGVNGWMEKKCVRWEVEVEGVRFWVGWAVGVVLWFLGGQTCFGPLDR
jgi:hypothetical protein